MVQNAVFSGSTVNSVSPLHLVNAAPPRVVTLAGICTVFSLSQSANAEDSITVTVEGMVTFVRPEPPNILPGMVRSPSGRLTSVSALQFENIDVPNEVTDAGIFAVFSEAHSEKALVPIAVSPSGRVTEVRARQLLNTSRFISFSVDGRVSEVAYLHHSKAYSPTTVMPSDRTIALTLSL